MLETVVKRVFSRTFCRIERICAFFCVSSATFFIIIESVFLLVLQESIFPVKPKISSIFTTHPTYQSLVQSPYVSKLHWLLLNTICNCNSVLDLTKFAQTHYDHPRLAKSRYLLDNFKTITVERSTVPAICILHEYNMNVLPRSMTSVKGAAHLDLGDVRRKMHRSAESLPVEVQKGKAGALTTSCRRRNHVSMELAKRMSQKGSVLQKWRTTAGSCSNILFNTVNIDSTRNTQSANLKPSKSMKSKL